MNLAVTFQFPGAGAASGPAAPTVSIATPSNARTQREYAALLAAHEAELRQAYADTPAPLAAWRALEAVRRTDPREPVTLLLRVDGIAAGCLAMRPFAGGLRDTAEITQLYLPPAFRGTGHARALLARAGDEARRAGHARLLLECWRRQRAAQSLWRAARFQRRTHFRALPPDLRGHLVAFECVLRSAFPTVQRS